ncbi:MAG: adenosylmethionine decarboxylase [Acidobacteriota bacterium]
MSSLPLHQGVAPARELDSAGVHLLADFWGARRLTDLDFVRRCLEQAVAVADATLLEIKLHHFSPNFGISGVALLAESHLSVHTWPEREYAAIDVFMCGDARPELAVESLRHTLQPRRIQMQSILRGRTEAGV